MSLGFRSQVESIYVYLLILLYTRKLQAQVAEVASVARLEHLLGVIAVDQNTTSLVPELPILSNFGDVLGGRQKII